MNGLSVKISIMDVEPMKAIMDIIKDMADDPEVPNEYKQRLCRIILASQTRETNKQT